MPSSNLTDNPSAVQEPTKYYEQLHRDCGGRLAICKSDAGVVAFFCLKCNAKWAINHPLASHLEAAPEWESCRPEGRDA